MLNYRESLNLYLDEGFLKPDINKAEQYIIVDKDCKKIGWVYRAHLDLL